MNTDNRTMEYLIVTVKSENAASDSELEFNVFNINVRDNLFPFEQFKISNNILLKVEQDFSNLVFYACAVESFLLTFHNQLRQENLDEKW